MSRDDVDELGPTGERTGDANGGSTVGQLDEGAAISRAANARRHANARSSTPAVTSVARTRSVSAAAPAVSL